MKAASTKRIAGLLAVGAILGVAVFVWRRQFESPLAPAKAAEVDRPNPPRDRGVDPRDTKRVRRPYEHAHVSRAILSEVRHLTSGDTADVEVVDGVVAAIVQRIDAGEWASHQVFPAILDVADEYPMLAFGLVSNLASSEAKVSIEGAVLSRFADRDPIGSLNFALAYVPYGESYATFAQILGCRAITYAPQAYLDWISSQQEDPRVTSLIDATANWLRSDASSQKVDARAIMDMDGIPDKIRHAAIDRFYLTLREQDWATWKARVFSEEIDRSDLSQVSRIAAYWPDGRSEELGTFVDELVGGAAEWAARDCLAGRLVREGRPADAASAVNGIEKADRRRSAASSAAHEIWSNDPGASVMYVSRLTNESDRRAALYFLVPRILVAPEGQHIGQDLLDLEHDSEQRTAILQLAEGMKRGDPRLGQRPNKAQ